MTREICTLSDGGNLSFGNSANLEKGAAKNEYLLRGRILEKSPYDDRFPKSI